MLKLWFVGDREEIPLVQEENFVEYSPAQQNLGVYELSDRVFLCSGGIGHSPQCSLYSL